MAGKKKRSSSRARADKTQKKTATKSRGGAPKGNTNAMKHGVYLNSLRRAKEEEIEQVRLRYKRNARAMLRELGVEKSIASRELATRYADLKYVQFRIMSYLDKRGWHDNKGNLKASVNRLVDVTNDQLKIIQRLLESLGRIGPAPTSPTPFIDLLLGAERREREASQAAGRPRKRLSEAD